MYGAGNPQMAALGALGALGGSLRDLAMAPVRRWSQASLAHKAVAAGAGAGLAYYLHKKGMADVAVAVAGLGGAYATSMVMHSRQVVQRATNGAALSNGQAVGALPPAQIESMAAQAHAVMNGGNGGNGGGGGGDGGGNGGNGMSGGSRWGALGPVASPQRAHAKTQLHPQQVRPVGAPVPVSAPAPVGAQAQAGGSLGKWDLLG